MKLIRFTAAWCPSCKRFAPILEAFAEKRGVPLVTVDVEEQPDLGTAYDVRTLPTTVLVDDGQVLKTITGAMPTPMLDSQLREFI